MTERLLEFNPAKYDESSELEGLEEEEHFFVSPHHVPLELRVGYDPAKSLVSVRFSYLTDQEATELLQEQGINVEIGSNSRRIISVEFKGSLKWTDAAKVLGPTRRQVNHYVTYTVLRDKWKDLLRLAQGATRPPL